MATQRRRVLLVEDDLAVQAALLGPLEAAGFEAVGAADATQALEVLAGRRIDVVVATTTCPGLWASTSSRRSEGRPPARR
jgi:DNA-binding response OmpR family regulator